MPIPPTVESLRAQLKTMGISLPAGPVGVDGYGDSPALSNELLGLIRDGKKRAGTGLLWVYEAQAQPVPQVGDIEIVIDHHGAPSLVTGVTGVELIPYAQVSPAYAAREGEGDGSLAYWRQAHWSYFTRECRRLGREPSEAMLVVCCIFEVLHVLPWQPSP